jgi:hypothetical protein
VEEDFFLSGRFRGKLLIYQLPQGLQVLSGQG